MQFFNHSSHCGPTIFIFVFSMQLSVNVQYKFLANDWIQTAYLWNWKRPLCQLNQNHCPGGVFICVYVCVSEIFEWMHQIGQNFQSLLESWLLNSWWLVPLPSFHWVELGRDPGLFSGVCIHHVINVIRLYHTIMENIDKHNKRVRTDTPTLFDYAGGSVTRIFLSNVFKSCPKWFHKKNDRFWTPLLKLWEIWAN